MAYSSNVSRRYKRQWLVGSNGKWLLIALLVFAFPVGLYIMWDESKWKPWIKIAVSALWTAIFIITAVLLGSLVEIKPTEIKPTEWLLIALFASALNFGLYIMWDESKWKPRIKKTVSALWAAILIIMIVLLFDLSEPVQDSQGIKWALIKPMEWPLIAQLVFAFTVSMYKMRNESEWKLWIKIAVSASWAAMLLLMIVFLIVVNTLAALRLGPLEHEVGRVELRQTEHADMLAPLPPENVPDTSQHTRSSRDESGLISSPTPTPRPTMVYCNDNGQYYHLAGCRYVYEGKTPKVTLTQAKNAGKTACPYCNPPKEETYND